MDIDISISNIPEDREKIADFIAMKLSLCEEPQLLCMNEESQKDFIDPWVDVMEKYWNECVNKSLNVIDDEIKNVNRGLELADDNEDRELIRDLWDEKSNLIYLKQKISELYK